VKKGGISAAGASFKLPYRATPRRATHIVSLRETKAADFGAVLPRGRQGDALS